MSTPDSEVTDYPLAPALRARLLGVLLVLLGLLCFVVTALIGLAHLPEALLLVLVALVLAAIVGAGIVLGRSRYVVRMDGTGYRVRYVRGAGATSARWVDVKDMGTTTVAGGPCVVLRLRDGRETTIPVGVLATDRDQFVRDLQSRLDDGHGMRPLG